MVEYLDFALSRQFWLHHSPCGLCGRKATLEEEEEEEEEEMQQGSLEDKTNTQGS